MPTYTYVCPDKHVTTKARMSVDDETITCPDCKQEAKRRPFYEETAVSFPGTGFTKTVIPPAKPKPGTVPGEPTADWLEKLDKFAEDNYKDDENVQPERKKQAERMLKERDRGAIP